FSEEKSSKTHAQGSEDSAFFIQTAQFSIWFFSDANLVESVESSAVFKSLITNKLRWFNVVGCSTRPVWFHKMLYHR
ncbi:hypothetical protein AAY53_17920, partial [Vibrio metoecus]